MRKFTVSTPYASYEKCFLCVNKYSVNKHVALSVWNEEDGPIANITVNLDKIKTLPANFSAVDTNNAPWAEALIKRLGIGKPTGKFIGSGFCMYPVYEFDMERIAKMCA